MPKAPTPAPAKPMPAKPEPTVEPGGEEEDKVVEIELSEEQCKKLLDELVSLGIVDWKHITSKILQSLQPPQTATHVPQLEGIRERYPASRRWAPARRWMYALYGPCPVCGVGMNLTHDHVLPRDLLADRADMLENLRFLCYRDNQSRHWEHGGALELGTAAACIYLLVTQKPKTLAEFTKMGRQLKLTQSSQRFEETWALAVHLYRQGKYALDEVHPAIEEKELQRFSDYYLEANKFFDAHAAVLEKRYAKEMDTASRIQLLVTTRTVKPDDRAAAAKSLGILENEGIKAAAAKTRITDNDRRLFLTSLGWFPDDEVEQIVAYRKVSLFHVLSGKDRAAVLAEIESTLDALQKKHGVKDTDAIPRKA